MQQFKITINDKPVLVSDFLTGWTIYDRQSSYIAYIAVNPAGNTLFIQFNNGTCFIYQDVPVDFIKAAIAAPSIGKFFHQSIKGTYEGEAVESHCIQPDIEAEEDDEDLDDLDLFASI